MPVKTISVDATQSQNFKIETKCRNHVALVDQPVEGGGTDSGPTPLEYLFISLAGCIASVGHIIAKQRRLPVRQINVHIEGEIDIDVLMGKHSNTRAGFTAVRVTTKFDADLSQSDKEQLLHDIDARCPISDNLLNHTPVEFFVE